MSSLIHFLSEFGGSLSTFFCPLIGDVCNFRFNGKDNESIDSHFLIVALRFCYLYSFYSPLIAIFHLSAHIYESHSSM